MNPIRLSRIGLTLLPVLAWGCATNVDVAIDRDQDGLLVETDFGTDPNNPDSDGDGHLDGAEITAGTNPLDDLDHPYMGGYEIDKECRTSLEPTGGYDVGDIIDNIGLPDQFGETVHLWDFCGKAILLTSGAFW